MESSGTVVTTPPQQQQPQQSNSNNNSSNSSSSSSSLPVSTTTSSLEGHHSVRPATTCSSSLRVPSPPPVGLGFGVEDHSAHTRLHSGSGNSNNSNSASSAQQLHHSNNHHHHHPHHHQLHNNASINSASSSVSNNLNSLGRPSSSAAYFKSAGIGLGSVVSSSVANHLSRESVGGGHNNNCASGSSSSGGTVSNNHHHNNLAGNLISGGSSSTSTGGSHRGGDSNSTSLTTTPSTARRTRHRVDAGEPRGCFNSYYSTAARNIFANPALGPGLIGAGGIPGVPPGVASSSFLLGNHASALYGVGGGPDLYFQPMKMLSEFIGNSHPHFNSHHSSPTPPTNNNSATGQQTNNNNNSPTAASQLLLREMLQKKKIGYEDEVNEMAREREIGGSSEGESVEGASSITGGVHNNNNNEEIKINGCKKRKLYQPQRTDFDDDPEEFKEDIDDDVDMHEYKHRNSGDEDDEILAKSPIAPLTRQILTGERKTIPKMILQRWKETLKTSLIAHITELVDSEFNALLESMGSVLNQSHHAISQGPDSRDSTHDRGQAGRDTGRDRGDGPSENVERSNHHGNSTTHAPVVRPNSSQPHHHHLNHNSRQQSVTPPPTVQNHISSGIPDSIGKTHGFNGGGGYLVNDYDKLPRGFRVRPPYSAALAGMAASRDMEEDGPLSLVVTPKKKRHKVTDTRLTPRAIRGLLSNGNADHYLGDTPSPRSNLPSPPPSMQLQLPTSVAIANPSLTESRHLFHHPYAPFLRGSLAESPPTMVPHPTMPLPHEYVQHLRELTAQQHREQQREAAHVATIIEREGGGSAGSADSIDTNGESFGLSAGLMYGGHSSSTLTPMHLRKAKLMFFWVRYPSSAVLKMYFPDIKFNKNNTAQLVKWFSNFREFYYIQMEKYARQALSEGIKVAEDIHVSTDNELYRVLNLHYNRNNHIEVPPNFRFVVEQTLREFFKSIQSGKDSEQSWKKAIYKIIARMDDPVPEYFKSPNFLEQLE